MPISFEIGYFFAQNTIKEEVIIMKLFKNVSLKNKLLLTVSIIVLLLIAIITTQSIRELNNRMSVDLEQELKSVGLLTAMNLNSNDVKDLLTEKGETNAKFKKNSKATR